MLNQTELKLLPTMELITTVIKNIIDKYPEAKLLEQIKARFKVNDINSLTREKGHKCLKMLIDYDKHHTEKEQQHE